MTFPLVGNSKIRLALENSIKEQHLPHAILIEGDIGTGRHTLADFISKAAVCSNDKAPCDICKNCNLANSRNHPDITIIAPQKDKKNIAVSQIRALRADAYIRPNQAQTRVFIIDRADTMNEQSQNALLKTLEEPPGSTVFILISENKAYFLDTIISRCVVLSLNSPSFDESYEFISSLNQFSGEEIESALKSTQNNIGKALLLLRGNTDTKTSAAAKEFLACMLKGNEWGMLLAVNSLENSRVESDRFFKDLKFFVVEEIKKNPKSIKAASLSKFYTKLCNLEEQLITNINLSLLFSALSSQAKECMI